MNKKALITGCGGMDGSYLAEFLLKKDYEVYGLVRYSTTNPYNNLELVRNNEHFHLVRGDVTDYVLISNIISQIEPDEIYNLAAQSNVRWSFDCENYTYDVNKFGFQYVLEGILELPPSKVKIYQASTSEMFGNCSIPQNEATLFHPVSPYAESKHLAHDIALYYRDHGYFISCGILFNHESPRRGECFVTRKITKFVGELYQDMGNKNLKLKLGNLSAKRDWGYAPEYVEAMWMMLQRDEPGDFVIGTGQSHSVQDFVWLAFELIGQDWHDWVEIDQSLFRPNDIDWLEADPTKAHDVLGWHHRTSFGELVDIMVEADKWNALW